MKTILALFLLAFCAFAQTTPPTPDPNATAQSTSFLSTLTSPNTLVMAGMVASQLADAKTDWHYTINGKQYTLTPATRLGMAGGIFGAALAMEQAWPKSRKAVQIIGTIITGYFAGRAVANTYNHGTDPATTPPATSSGATPKIAFAVQFGR